ncbi:MAG: RNA ligase (ATP) [Methanogenium sp.]|jgi:RNA ligase (TIGR02306 family)
MRKLATIQQIEDVQPIENADSIEKVKIKEWWVVSKKDTFKKGDLCVYFEIDSLLPSDNPEFEFLSKGTKEKTMMIEGKEYKGYRLKTIKLRGQVSQGLALPIDIAIKKINSLSQEEAVKYNIYPDDFTAGVEVSDLLNVVKYEPPVPANLSGVMKGFFPGFIPRTDEERIQNCADILEKHKGETFYITEKLDGSSVTYYKRNGEFGVCGRNWELKETEENTMWRVAKEMNLIEKLEDGFAIQGEIIGEGIQKNPLKIKGQRIYFFNVYDIKKGRYLDFKDFVVFCQRMGINTVPIVDSAYTLSSTAEELIEMANGKSLLCETANREGLVFRPIVEGRDEINGSISRLSFKVVSNDYLLKEE